MKNNKEKENKIINQLFKKSGEVSLSLFERRKIEGNLAFYMDKHPMRRSSDSVLSPFFSNFQFKQKKFMIASFALVLIIMGGTSAFANGALPGDLLYPIKLNVNEGASSLFSFGTKSNAQLKVNHADERLVEIEKLSSANRLNAPAVAAVLADFNKDAEKIKEHVIELKAKGKIEDANEVSSSFETSLQNHHSLIVALAEKEEKEKNNEELLSNLAVKVEAHLQVASLERKDTENTLANSTTTIEIKSPAEIAMKSAKNTITEVEKYINLNGEKIPLILQTEANIKLKDAKGWFAEGEAKILSDKNSEAFIAFKKAKRKAEEVKLMLNSKNESEEVLTSFFRAITNYDNTRISEENSSTTTSFTSPINVNIKIDSIQ